MSTDSLQTKPWKTRRKHTSSIFNGEIMRRAIVDSLKKLDPRWQLKNPVMFVVEVGSALPIWYFEFDPLGCALA